MIDWLSELEKKFGDDVEISKLKEKGFYGKITINFFNGQIVDLNKYETRKPVIK